jgi:hypothetical protein
MMFECDSPALEHVYDFDPVASLEVRLAQPGQVLSGGHRVGLVTGHEEPEGKGALAGFH